MDKQQALNLIIQVVLGRATGTSQEIDAWRTALQILQEVIVPLPPSTKEVKKEEVATTKQVLQRQKRLLFQLLKTVHFTTL